MRMLLALLLCGLPAMAASTDHSVRVAIIIDDLGNSLDLAVEAIELPAALTYSVLPQRPYSHEVARRAHRSGKEVMLHLPMEARKGGVLGKGGLYSHMTRDEFARQVREGVADIPYVVGVNNHMGSLLTRKAGIMRWLMQDLHCIGGLYFVDSRTDVGSVAGAVARDAGLPVAQRDVFLDHDPAPAAVRLQLNRLIAKARKRGSAIGIGHPYPETFAVLSEFLPTLKAQGVEVVPVSRLLKQRRRPDTWYACSSPLPKVAKNSKQSP